VLQLQVQFPERPGALRRFLNSLSSEWNVTLFHYRNTGNQQSYVMLGLQVAPDTDKAFKKVLKSLQDEFTFEELGGEERKVFNMFIQ
jgi:threonine dehydratase